MASDGSETPPDSTGAIGPSNYVEMDNSNIAVYDRSLNLIQSMSLNSFTGSGLPFCDVQVQWDSAAQRFLFSFLMCDLSLTSNQQFWFGWSKTADPTNLASGWCEFGAGTGSLLLDYDKLGHSSKYLVVGGNLYDTSVSSTNPPFVSAGIAWFKMPANGVTSCGVPASGANNLPQFNGDGSTPTFTPVPVNTTSSASDVWIVSAYDPAGNVDTVGAKTKLATWDLDSAGVLHPRADVIVNSYQAPTPAAQSGTANRIDTLDGRLTQAVGNNSAGIYTQHTVLDSGGRSEVDWYELAVSGPNLVLIQQGAVDTASAWTFNAAISPRWDGQGAAIFYNVSSTSQDPSIVTRVRRAATSAGAFEEGPTTLATSPAPVTETLSCNVGGFPCRWGDYSGASPDPVETAVVWGTNMFNTASGSSPAWADQNFAVHVPQAPGPVATTPIARTDGRGEVAVSWSAAGFEPDACPSYRVDVFVGGVATGMSLSVPGPALGAQIAGLNLGTTYTFTVTALNCGIAGPTSAQSGPASPGGIIQASPAPTPPSRGVTPEPTASPQPR